MFKGYSRLTGFFIALIFLLTACGTIVTETHDAESTTEISIKQYNPKDKDKKTNIVLEKEQNKSKGVVEGQAYDQVEEVAQYVHQYDELPPNYLTKEEANRLGWDSEKGNLWKVAPNMSIGGDRFRNFEGQLQESKNRIYYEADIDYQGGYRNAKRLVFSNDGLFYYTEDHYDSFKEIEVEGY